MKKIFTLLLAFIAINTFAQRTADFQMLELVSPTVLNSEQNNTTPFPLNFVIQNNGPDTMTLTDSFAFQLLITNPQANNAIILAYPSAQARLIVPLRKVMHPGDTLHHSVPLQINSVPDFSLLVNIIIQGNWINRATEDITDPVANNNANGQLNVIWYNKNRDGVSIFRPDYVNNLNVYPNPASDIVSIQMELLKVENTKVALYDMNGRLIISETNLTYFDNTGYQLNIADVPNGIYMLQVTNGEEVHTGRVVVSH
jgi:hypothetical protein